MPYEKIGNIKGAPGEGVLWAPDGVPYVTDNPAELPPLDGPLRALLEDPTSMSGSYLANIVEALTPDTAPHGLIYGEDGRVYAIVAGTARNDGTGWQPHVNSTHATIGVASMTTDSQQLTINYPGRGHAKAVAFVAAPDETLATAGITLGASVGNTKAIIRFGGHVGYSGYLTYDGSTPNVYTVRGDEGLRATWSNTNGCIQVTHPDLPVPYASASGGFYDIQVTGRGAFRYEVADSITPTRSEFGIVPRGLTDTSAHTAASSAHKLFVSHHTSGPLDAMAINTNAYPNSNIWYFGIFELTTEA